MWMEDLWRWAVGQGLRVFWVGGTVRDLLLGRKSPDADVAVQIPEAARWADIIADFQRMVAARGDSVVVLQAEKRAYRWVLKGPRAGGKGPNVLPPTPYARSTDRWVDVVFFEGPIGHELARRDFTINAMAIEWTGPVLSHGSWLMGDDYEPSAIRPEAVIDPWGGRSDLERGILRVVRPENLWDDPVRIVRAYRLAAQLGFQIEPTTRQYLALEMPALTTVPGERLHVEILKWLMAPHADVWIQAADEDDLWETLFPDVGSMKGCEQGGYHHKDVWGHTLEVVQAVSWVVETLGSDDRLRDLVRQARETPFAMDFPRYPFLKLAALLHDVGKPYVRSVRRPGIYAFIGHAEAGARIVDGLLERLRLSHLARDWVRWLVRYHMVPLEAWKAMGLGPSAAYLLRRFGPEAPWLAILAAADQFGKAGPRMEARRRDEFVDLARRVAERVLWGSPEEWTFPLRGADLVEGLGLPPGPAVGRLLERLRRDWERGRFHTRAEGLAYARRLNP
ncbi:MAG: HD domain-containing protein [Acidobacteria bacterium]|nr:HD domain-containing protein [Acidobacteriota bacterium]